jgi:hypothetical protein
MLWWLEMKRYERRAGTRSSPLTLTLTPVVARMSRDQRRAHLWANSPVPVTAADATDTSPRTIV